MLLRGLLQEYACPLSLVPLVISSVHLLQLWSLQITSFANGTLEGYSNSTDEPLKAGGANNVSAGMERPPVSPCSRLSSPGQPTNTTKTVLPCCRALHAVIAHQYSSAFQMLQVLSSYAALSR